MNTLNKFLAAAATATVLLSSNAAFADTSRAEVVAQLAQARADGSIASLNSDDSEHFLKAPVAATTAKAAAPAATVAANANLPKTRAQVIAELRASQQDGTLALMHSEFAGDHMRLAVMQAQKAAATAMAE
ncbi:DUF4148 domain-containing protein [Paucibacter sp. R3-3]|uniref:DUF4148 domain-containing protein n=1 Tax=Roseateles agri TaxID=3098619 RepID=A0ABU5DF20_9BURK|nr:DUF4148 domain-containing protein [Paucibacter sp. R3-3]MDY0744872.1 DUF4148 domain-containing protein [Paucibacter sp. R3-3]